MDHSSPFRPLNLYGSDGEAVFTRISKWAATDAADQHAIWRRLSDDLDHVKDLNDDRLLVLLGAMILENSVDDILAAIMPGFNGLRDNRDFSFSMRTAVLRALRLIPSRILSYVDLVRQMRNDFAHQLTVRTFDHLKPERLVAMRNALKEFSYNQLKIDENSDTSNFYLLIACLSVALQTYRRHVVGLNAFLRSEALAPALAEYVTRHDDSEP